MPTTQLVEWAILACLFISGLTVAVAAWIPRQKRLADWLMAVGSAIMPLGLLALVVYHEFIHSYIEWFEYVLVGGSTCGATLFALGYLLDRIGRRCEQEYQVTQRAVMDRQI